MLRRGGLLFNSMFSAIDSPYFYTQVLQCGHSAGLVHILEWRFYGLDDRGPSSIASLKGTATAIMFAQH